MTRRWTATVTFERNGRAVRRFEAVNSDADLQNRQARFAISQAIAQRENGEDAHIQLNKTTKANGTVRDQSWFLAAGEFRATR
ncbi:MAG: hypothetical protein WAL84_01945 [Candidatus Dormiibacterota bacterium]